MASGTSPRERKDAVWPGFQIAGGLWALRSRSARFSSRLSTRPRAQRSAESAVFYACRFDEQSEQETHVNADRAAGSDRRMLEGACPACNSRCAAAHQHTATRCMSIRTARTHSHAHPRAHKLARVHACVRALHHAAVNMRHSSRVVASTTGVACSVCGCSD